MIRFFSIIALCSVWCFSLEASSFRVSPTSPGGIAAAIEKAAIGDTIILSTGSFSENAIAVPKRLTFIAEGNVVIDGMDKPDNIFFISADSVEIRGVRLTGVGVSFLKEIAAIKLVQCSGVRIIDNHISKCFFGIYLEYASNCVISGNTVDGQFIDEASAGNAIHIWKADSITVSDNIVHGHRDGIYFEFVDDSRIEGNTSYSNLRYGLHFMFSNRDIYKENVFENNGAGVAVMFSKDIIMNENSFLKNWGGASYGLLLKEISDGNIGDNLFEYNTIGILAEGANRLVIEKNEFVANGTAIDMKGNSLDNRILSNNFIANTFEVVTNSKYNNNEYSDNYWSGYVGYDLDRDGVGDVPYRPVNLFAKVTRKIPSATIMMHSIIVGMIEMMEKTFPQFIPQELLDSRPKMTAYDYDRG